jgi:cell division protein FtsA
MELHSGMSCRVGVPVENLAHGYHESVCSPIFSTSIGLLLRGLNDLAPEKEQVVEHQHVQEPKITPSNVSEEKESSWLDNVFKKTKEWFEAEPDMDFNKKQ